jgi:hypothetical protein
MDAADLERIVKLALRELGTGDAPVSLDRDQGSDRWRVSVRGAVQTTMTIRAGAGTSPQFIREQVFEQFQGR